MQQHPITPEALAAARKLYAEATAGPWEDTGNGIYFPPPLRESSLPLEWSRNYADFTFIAATKGGHPEAPSYLALVDEVERLQEELERAHADAEVVDNEPPDFCDRCKASCPAEEWTLVMSSPDWIWRHVPCYFVAPIPEKS